MTTTGFETYQPTPEKYKNGIGGYSRSSPSIAEVLLACQCRETSMRLTSHHLEHPGNVTAATRWPSRVSSIFSWQRRLTTLGSSLSHHLVIFLILISCCSATQPLYPSSISDPRVQAPEEFRLALQALAESGTIIVDQRPPPLGAAWSLESADDDLWKRDPLSSSSGSSASSSSGSSTSTSSPTVAATATSSGTNATGTSSSLPLPSPFDSFLDSNFTNPGCPQYFHTFLADAAFKACLPFSLLLSVSPSSTNSIARI
jgi:hypothetical protein